MKLPPTRTVRIANLPENLERPELFQIVSQVVYPQHLFFTPKQAFVVFALESEQIDFIESIKTSPLELFDQILKITPFISKIQAPKPAEKIIVPISYKDSKTPENQFQKKLQKFCKDIDNVKHIKQRGYNAEKALITLSTCELEIKLKKTADPAKCLVEIQKLFKFARLQSASAPQLIIRNIPITTTFEQFSSIFRSTFHFPVKKVVFSGKKWAIVTLFSLEDAQKCVKMGQFVIGESSGIVDFVTSGGAGELGEPEQAEIAEEEHSFEIEEGISEAEDGSIKVSSEEEEEVKIQIYDPKRPLEEQLKEVDEEEVVDVVEEKSDEVKIVPKVIMNKNEKLLSQQIFIQNLPIYLPNQFTKSHSVKQTLRHILMKYFKFFGQIESIIVTEKSENINGTAFITFETFDCVEKVLDFVRFLQKFKTAKVEKADVKLGKNENFGQEIKQYCRENHIKPINWEYLDLNQGGFSINSQVLYVSRALKQEALNKKLSANQNSRNEDLFKYEAKNTGSGSENNVPQADLLKRNILYKELKEKSLNTNYHFVRTRLVVKNLPKEMDENSFWLNVYRYFVGQKKLIASDKFTMQDMQKCMNFKVRQIDNESFYFLIQQLKIIEVRMPREETNTFDMARCKGYNLVKRMEELATYGYFEKAMKQVCFLEFETFESACYFFKLIDNNDQIFGKNKRPILSFAVKDIGKEKGRENKKKEDEK